MTHVTEEHVGWVDETEDWENDPEWRPRPSLRVRLSLWIRNDLNRLRFWKGHA